MNHATSKKGSKIIITGGHSTPAFAVLDELLKRNYKKENIIWVGEKHNQRKNKNLSAEFQTITNKYKIKFINIKAGKLIRKWSRQTFRGGIFELVNLFLGFIQSFFIILKKRPDLIISFGGFLAVPIVFWGKIFGAKIITHEQTIVTGLANKIISKFANKILISFKDSEKYFPQNKVVFTGNPLREDINIINSKITDDLDKNLPIIYITGGNQGAHEINKRVFEIIEKLLLRANVIHQTGNSSVTNDYKKALKIKENLKEEYTKRYIIRDYVYANEIGEVLQKSDILFSRAGANTVQEILVLGKMALLMPIPWTSHDEQTKNALMIENVGLGKLIKQEEQLTSQEVFDHLINLLNLKTNNLGTNGKSLDVCSQNAKKLVVLNASSKIVDIIEAI